MINILFKLHILSSLILIPIITSLAIAIFQKQENENYISIFGSFINLLISLYAIYNLNYTNYEFQFLETYYWLKLLKLEIILGVDAISIVLIGLNNLLCFLMMIFIINKKIKYPNNYQITLLIITSLLNALFSTLNLLLFFIIFEAILIPIFFIIGIWGAERRIYAAFKFFLYTFFGSIFFIAAIILINNFVDNLNIIYLYENINLVPKHIQHICYICFIITFLIKIPLIPFHNWLPDAHVEAPTEGSVILSAILLKMGVYGFIRIAIICFPHLTSYYNDIIIIISIISMIYVSILVFSENNLKKIIAYSSIAHMAYVTAGIFSSNQIGISGAIFQIISHGLNSAGLFLVAGIIYSRTKTQDINNYSGLAKYMPKLSIIFMILTLSSIGMPLTSGFISEFFVIWGISYYNKLYMIFFALGFVLSAIYMLNLYQKTMFGLPNKLITNVKDVNNYELYVLIPIISLILILGIHPSLLLNYIDMSISNLKIITL